MNSDTEIVDRLASAIAEERQQAIQRLDTLGPRRALDILISALGDDRWRIRKTAIEALEAYPDSDAVIGALIPLLGEKSDANHRNAAIEFLTFMGKKALPALLRAMRDKDSHVRKLCADILGLAADPSAEEALITALRDADENVRIAAAEALGNYNDKNSSDALLRLLHGPDLTLKFCAIESLAQIGMEIPMREIKPLVEQKILRRAVFDALGSIANPEAARILIEGLSDDSPSTRNAAIRSLGKIFIAHPITRQSIEDELKKRAASNGLLNVLLQALSDNNPDVQKGALRLLGLLRDPESAPKIIEAARESDLEQDALEAIKSLAEKSSWTVLKNLPSSSDPLYDVLSSATKFSPALSATAIQQPFSPASTEMTEDEFLAFRNYLHDFCGIHFKDDMKYIVEKRLLKRMEALSIPTFAHYLNMVMRSIAGKQEMWEAVSVLTTNETYFFREKFQLKAFYDEILPQIQASKEKTNSRRLRVLSAGCSSGEEPYTLAMLIDESGLFAEWDVRIVGGDLSERMLEQARSGIYRKGSFRTTPPEYIKRYFQQMDNDSWKIIDRVGNLVEFSHINLFNRREVEMIGPFDVVFCRNVIIYFDLSAKKRVIESLYNSMLQGGYLLLGHSESLVNISARFDLVHLKSDMVYRKPLTGVTSHE